MINRQLKKRFGELTKTVQSRIETLSVEQLESLGESLLDFSSLSDLLSWLENANS